MAVGVACGDGTGPGARVALSVTSTQGPYIGYTGEGREISCGADLRATLTGRGEITWTGGVLRFYMGADQAEPVNEQQLSLAEVRETWDGPTLAAGDTVESRWIFFAGAPFEVEFIVRYRSGGGGEREAAVRIPCGPEVSASSPPPSVTRAEIVAPAEPLEPGDMLQIEYAATSADGLWASQIVLWGPCEVVQTIDEDTRLSVARTVSLAIPRGCSLGVPISVAVYVQDVGLREGSRIIESTLRLVDVTPPSVGHRFYGPGSITQTPVQGTFFVGEQLTLDAYANDNHGLASLGWEAQPVNQSGTIEVSGLGVERRVTGLAPRPDWIGADVRFRVSATDLSGNVAYTIWSEPGALRVLPTVERPVKSAEVSGEIRDFVVDEPRQVVYLLQSNERRIAIVSMTTMAVTLLPLPSHSASMALSASGDSLILAMPLVGALGVIDLRQPALTVETHQLTSLDASEAQQPHRVRVTSNGKAFVALEGTTMAAWQLLEVDLATGAERIRIDAGDGSLIGHGMLEVSLDRSVMVVNGGETLFQRYDAATDQFGARRSVLPYNALPALDATGHWTVVGLQLFDESLTLVRRVESRGHSSALSVPSADGQYVFQVPDTVGIIRSRTVDGSMVDRTHLPFLSNWMPSASSFGLATTRSGRWVILVSNSYSGPSGIAVIEML